MLHCHTVGQSLHLSLNEPFVFKKTKLNVVDMNFLQYKSDISSIYCSHKIFFFSI